MVFWVERLLHSNDLPPTADRPKKSIKFLQYEKFLMNFFLLLHFFTVKMAPHTAPHRWQKKSILKNNFKIVVSSIINFFFLHFLFVWVINNSKSRHTWENWQFSHILFSLQCMYVCLRLEYVCKMKENFIIHEK